jgi:hypothetical protein
MKKPEPKFTCPCCGTLAAVTLEQLNPQLVGTLDLLKRVVTPVSTPVLFAVPDISNKYIKITGLNNRLAKLEELGLVKSERRGKAKYWEVVKS